VTDERSFPSFFEGWETLAKEKVYPKAFGYMSSGAGKTLSLLRNVEAFDKLQLIPRVLRDVSHVSLKTHFLQKELEVPYMLAPIGFHEIVHLDGELASARAANKMKVPFIQSTVSSHALEVIRKELTDVPHYFQLYWPNDEAVSESFIRRLENAGVDGIVVTVDTPVLGRREIDLKHQYFPMQTGAGMANYLTDPVFNARYNPNGSLSIEAIREKIQSILFHPGLTFDHIEKLVHSTDLPIILKGVLHPEDAKRAMALGVSGLIISNHGGRQLDGSVDALTILPEIRKIAGHDFTLILDGGIRRGSDVVKAFLKGADFVLLGRPYLYGLVEGEAGVKAVLTTFNAEIESALMLIGASNMSETDSSMLLE